MDVWTYDERSPIERRVDLEKLRQDYGKLTLDEGTAGNDPIALLAAWLEDAVKADVRDANAMVMATVDAEARPSSRVVLLRGLGAEGLAFYTNYESRKGTELAGSRHAAALFFWAQLERQVRVEGDVSRLPAAASDAYFASRPHASRLAAVASPQSQPIEDRSVLDTRFHELEAMYPEGTVVPRPAHWGGYLLAPRRIEFWQGGKNRLHDRIVFTRATTAWQKQRLAP